MSLNVTTMKALVCDKLGSPDFLEIREIEKPTPKKNEVLLKIRAVSINDWDWGLLQDSFVNRLMAGLRKRQRIVGCDVAGLVESAGQEVKRFKRGDAVFGDLSGFGSGAFGGFAEYVCARENSLVMKPEVRGSAPLRATSLMTGDSSKPQALAAPFL